MMLYRYRSRPGAPLVVLLLSIGLQPWAAGQPASSRPEPAAERGADGKTKPTRKPLRPLLSPYQTDGQIIQPDEGAPRDPLSQLSEDAMEAPIDGDRYRLGPGDQLAISISARTPTSYSAAVAPDGSLYLPLAGEVSVGGKTLNEARRVIEKQQERIRRRGTFTTSIRLTRLRRLKVQVLGEVQRPATYLVSPLTRIVEVLARAGGLTPIASRRHVRLTRGEAQPDEIDLEEILLRGNAAANRLLETGDVIYVPRARQIVTVSGEVHRPGDYECDPGDTLAALLERAGGVASQGAVSAIQIERPEAGDRRRLLVADLNGDGGTVRLQDRDRVVVPELTTLQGRLRIIGAVKGTGDNWQPDNDPIVPRTLDLVSGVYLLRNGDRIRDVIENVGGTTAKADVAHTVIERPDGVGGKARIPVDLHRALVLQDPAQNLELRDGDTLLIPKIQDKVYVLGEVPRQGEQEYVEGKTVLDYVGMAGGPAPRAKRQETVIVRTEGTEQKIIKVGLDRFLSGKKPPQELAVKPGDLIVVPQASIRGWQEFAQLFFTLRSLATGLFLFR